VARRVASTECVAGRGLCRRRLELLPMGGW